MLIHELCVSYSFNSTGNTILVVVSFFNTFYFLKIKNKNSKIAIKVMKSLNMLL